MSSDGYLTAEALLPPPKYADHLSVNGPRRSSPSPSRRIPVSSPKVRTSPMLPRRDYEDCKEEFSVEVDISNFQPEDVKISTEGRLLRVRAKSFENVNKRSTSKELNKEIRLPISCDPDKIKAFFSAGGKLILKEVWTYHYFIFWYFLDIFFFYCHQ